MGSSRFEEPRETEIQHIHLNDTIVEFAPACCCGPVQPLDGSIDTLSPSSEGEHAIGVS
jgi:hypothetical protein